MSLQDDILILRSLVEEPNMKFIESIVLVAHRNNVSDIHIDPGLDVCSIRFRCDGVLVFVCSIASAKYQELLLLIKVISKLRIDDHYSPKDGSFELGLENQTVTVRVSMVYTKYGENVVMRLLSRNKNYTLNELGFEESSISILRNFIQKPNGLIVVSGSTGSGKSTTLYSIISLIDNQSKNIITIEDPIEMVLEGVRQIDIGKSMGIGFSEMLRSILRQDPDVIMVGEIRDKVTAELVFETSLTGHMVLSSLHISSICLFKSRLFSMGVPEYLIEAVPTLVINQELVRAICVCGSACADCNYTGYKNRTLIYEITNEKLSKKERILQKTIDGVISLEDASYF